jgi:alpha-methylacyl-CoA racemase
VSAGPLAGIKVLEIQSLGPGPFTAMMLANLGANVLRVASPASRAQPPFNPVLDRGRCGEIVIDLKAPDGREQLLGLIEQADVLIEGFRPGVMERLGVGPDDCLARNAQLIYGRVTGWGRSGPLAERAGHDINYLALSGALHASGSRESGPWPALNLVADFGGGGMLLALGIACALFESGISGKGQIVDAAMLDGSATLMSMIYGLRANGRWPAARAGNFLDGSAYYYTTYRCADDEWVAVGAIEPPFRRALFDGLGLADEADALMRARDDDPAVRERLAAIFRTRTRAQWSDLFADRDACVSPVLTIDEAADDAHNRASGSLRRIDGATQPAAAPRFSRTPATPWPSPDAMRADLGEWQFDGRPAARAAAMSSGSERE